MRILATATSTVSKSASHSSHRSASILDMRQFCANTNSAMRQQHNRRLFSSFPSSRASVYPFHSTSFLLAKSNSPGAGASSLTRSNNNNRVGAAINTLGLNQIQCQHFASRTIKVPSMGDSITEGTLNEWKKNPGDFVNQDEVVAIIDTDKVSVDINAPASGVVEAHLAKPGDTILVGADLFKMDEGAAMPAGQPAAEAAAAKEAPAAKTPEQPTKAAEAPKAENKAAAPAPQKASPPSPSPSSPKSSSVSQLLRTEERVPMSRLRKRVAERLKHAQNSAASLTTFQEVDMGNLMALRSEMIKEFTEAHGIKFGFVSAFLYVAARALQKMPQVNGYISECGGEIIYKNYADISVAVATPTGLLVPVIRDCERKSIAELEMDLVDVAKRAREGKIALEEMAGGTFSISNGGVFGSMMGTPILNSPQSSILGLHSIKDRPVVKDGEIIIRPMMYLALTYDHRLLDGREAVLFLNRIKVGIEEPRRLLLDL